MTGRYICGIILAILCLTSATTAEEGVWTRKADMPILRRSFSANMVNDKIYVIGGMNNSGNIAQVEVYDPAEDKWTRKSSNMPTPRHGSFDCLVDGMIYTIGGAVGYDMVSTVEAYDPATDTWTRKADIPTPRGFSAAGAVNGRIYAFGGSRMNTDPWQPLEEGVVEEYDTGTGIPWIRVSQFSPQEGRTTGGNLLAILGSNFPPGVSVTIGGKPIEQVEVTDTLITGLTPPGTEGEHDIWLTAPGLDYSIPVGKFIYNPPSNVAVERITPDNGKQAGGDMATIAGSGFLPGARVAIGERPATTMVIDDMTIEAVAPPNPQGVWDVKVVNPAEDLLRFTLYANIQWISTHWTYWNFIE